MTTEVQSTDVQLTDETGRILWVGPRHAAIGAALRLTTAGYRGLTVDPVDLAALPPVVEIAPAPVSALATVPALDPVPATVPALAPVSAPVSAPTGVVEGGGFTYSGGGPSTDRAAPQVVQGAADRAVADAAYLEAALGIVLPAPVYAPGSALVSEGRDNLARSHRDWAALPDLGDQLVRLAARIREEGRIDVPVSSRTAIDPVTGALIPHTGNPRAGALAIETQVWPEVVAAAGLGRGSAPLLSAMDGPDRAALWDRYQGEVETAGRWVARTRVDGQGRRAVYGVVSEDYRSFDADEIADLVRAALPRIPGGRDLRGEVVYRPGPATVAIDARWHAQGVQDFGAGDVFSVGFRITSSDVGGGALAVRATALRNLCLNLIIVAEGRGSEVTIRHTGTRRAIAERLAEGIARVSLALAPFARRWGYAGQPGTLAQVLPHPEGTEDPILGLALARQVAGLPLPRAADDRDSADRIRATWPDLSPAAGWEGTPRATIASAIERSWSADDSIGPDAGVDSIARAINAITRLHREPLPIPTVQTAERHAGLLLRQLTGVR